MGISACTMGAATRPIPSSTHAKEKPDETSDTLVETLGTKKIAAPSTRVSTQGTRRPNSASLKQTSSSVRVQNSEQFSKPPKKKRKRLKLIEEHKENCQSIEYQESKSKKCALDLVPGEAPKQVNANDTWMSKDVPGLVETEELGRINKEPHGSNPWEYLWKPGAPPFELEIVSCAHRRNVARLGAYNAI